MFCTSSLTSTNKFFKNIFSAREQHDQEQIGEKKTEQKE